MLINDKIIFDCINYAQMKEIMVHYILQPRQIFILMLILGGVQLLIIKHNHALRGAQ